MKEVKFGFLKTCIGLTLVIGTMANANFGNPSSMMSSPFSSQGFAQPQQMQSFGNSVPWSGQTFNQPRYSNSRYAAPRQRYAQQQPAYNPMPWAMSNSPSRQAQPSQSFGGMSMMPFNPGMQPQQQYRQPQSSFMMPGMDQGVRSMMEPGKIMAEEATPGVYMKPTWR